MVTDQFSRLLIAWLRFSSCFSNFDFFRILSHPFAFYFLNALNKPKNIFLTKIGSKISRPTRIWHYFSGKTSGKAGNLENRKKTFKYKFLKKRHFFFFFFLFFLHVFSHTFYVGKLLFCPNCLLSS